MAKLTHGESDRNKNRTCEYETWARMISRCHGQDPQHNKDYKDRGISVCEEWRDFRCFLRDMGRRPKGHTLERLDNSGNYSKENCKWATPKEQANNRRNNKRVSYNGETLTISQWADKTGIPRKTLERRFQNNWSVKRALTTKKGKYERALRNNRGNLSSRSIEER